MAPITTTTTTTSTIILVTTTVFIKPLFDIDFLEISDKSSHNTSQNNNYGTIQTQHSVPGFLLEQDFITQDEAVTLIQAIDSEQWVNDFENKRVQIYGYNYLNPSQPPRLIPPFLLPILEKVSKFGKFDHIIISEYLTGVGIDPHIDRLFWGEIIIGISLLSQCTITLTKAHPKQQGHPDHDLNSVDVCLPERSLYCLTGDARYKYTHAIDSKYITSRRISITIRSMATQKTVLCSEDAYILDLDLK